MAPGCSAASLWVSKALRVCVLGALLYRSVCAGLYSDSDQIVILNPDNVESVLFNSTSAAVVEFYASWCGHCISFSPKWKDLARDVKEWKPVVTLAAIDCADELNRRVCTRFSISGYPSLKFFPAFSSSDFKGHSLRGFPREVQGLRHLILDKLEYHKEAWPPACPSLKPISLAELGTARLNATGHHVVLVFEEADSYVGREVILDLVQYRNVSVRRVLRSEEGLVSHLGVRDFPSCYLYRSHTNFSRLSVLSEARSFYSYALQRLPGVARAGKPAPAVTDLIRNQTEEPWRPFNKTHVYMSDLESALHYSLRVELASHPKISDNALKALRSYVSVLAKYFPGRPPVKAALKAVHDWLQEKKGSSVSYGDFREMLDTKSTNAFLPAGVRWVACQGSKPHYRGYPCAMWTLFHTLTVQAEDSRSTDPQEVLQAMRGYVHHFFGCRECAVHFESMAQESMDEVLMLSKAILWLWSRHNRVNSRLAGALSEDPHFPKLQWPPPDLCPSCHGLTFSGEHAWVEQEVLRFLRSYYSARGLQHHYVSDEFGKPLKDRRRARATVQKEAGIKDVQQLKENRHGGPNFQKRRMKRRDSEDGVHSSGRRMKRDLAALEAKGRAGLVKEAEPEPYIQSQSQGWMLLLSTIAILAVCLYFSIKLHLRRAKVALL